ncbi:MAG: UPF0280 family protein [Geminicoccaceae bacterium]
MSISAGQFRLQAGPIDLRITLEGDARDCARARERECARARENAERAFPDILPGLVGELAILRRRLDPDLPAPDLDGPVARRMVDAAWPHAARFVTPMAAVAGAVADEMLDRLTVAGRLHKAHVNNGGDIAIHLAPGASVRLALVGNIANPSVDGMIDITSASPVRGVATSGWRGRSFSLGIADSVTVLARTAAAADVAATLVANAVDADDPAILRQPAVELDPDSDLGELPVTVDVGQLPRKVVLRALERGAEHARFLIEAGRIEAAALFLAGEAIMLDPTNAIGAA